MEGEEDRRTIKDPPAPELTPLQALVVEVAELATATDHAIRGMKAGRAYKGIGIYKQQRSAIAGPGGKPITGPIEIVGIQVPIGLAASIMVTFNEVLKTPLAESIRTKLGRDFVPEIRDADVEVPPPPGAGKPS